MLDVANQLEIVCDTCYDRLEGSALSALEHEQRKCKVLEAEVGVDCVKCRLCKV